MKDVHARVRSPVEVGDDDQVVEMVLEGATVENDGTVRIAGGREDMIVLGEAISSGAKFLPEDEEEDA